MRTSFSCESGSLDDPSYLLSSILTIADSLHEHSSASIHDLLDAYATFTNRLRPQSLFLESCDVLLPAFNPLRVQKDEFICALRRDVRLAHIDPLSTFEPYRWDDASFGTSVLPHPNADAKQYAKDSSSLCNYALCVLTTILRFPAFHFVFPEHDLSILFNDALEIALTDQLPVFNKTKTYSLSLWTLGVHRLSTTVLDSRRHDVFSALKRTLDDKRQPIIIILDGLKAISHTVDHHPSGFLGLLPLLPHMMTNLHSKSSELRLHAAIALGKFANALLRQPRLSLTQWQTISNNIIPFVESCCDETKVPPGDLNFLRVIRTAFSGESHAHAGVAPTWILAVLASFIVLCGPTLYAKPTALRFILQALGMTLTHKRSTVRALHPHVWACFVWTFGQMLLSPDLAEPTSISLAFHIIKQEVGGGIGIALVNVLLSDQTSDIRSDERDDRVFQALSVIKKMILTECKHTRHEGFRLLQALTNNVQARHQFSQDVYEIPALALFNGAIIGTGWSSLPSAIHSIPRAPVSVRCLQETEIARHYKTLVVIWKDFAIKVDRNDLKSGLVDVWLSILLACSHGLECRRHDTVTPDVLYTAEIIAQFLPPVPSGDCEPDWGSWNVHDQLSCLTFIDQLWSGMRNAFAALGLAEAAELILTSILKYAFHVLDLGVRTLWGRLCANLMTTASISFLCDTHDHVTSQLIIRSRRELWGVIATSLSSSDLGPDWEEFISFLAIPICTWVLTKSELDTWEALLQNIITVSGDSVMVVERLVLHHFQGREFETWESITAMLGILLTCTLGHSSSLSSELLSMIDVCLTISYGRACLSSRSLVHSFELLNAVRHMIISVPDEVMHILQALCNSLCLWIEDHSEVMSDDEFNSVAVSLYCEALKALEILPLSIQSLKDTENFLASAFSRIPTPAIAPFAFERFWRATYHGHNQFCAILPSKIKSCLASFVAAYGGDLADGLPPTTESQSQSVNKDSMARLSISSQHQHSREFADQVIPLPFPINTKIQREAFDVEAVLPGQMATSQDDSASHMAPYDDTLQPTALRQLQEYSSRIDTSSPPGSERSMFLSMFLSPIHPPRKSDTSYMLSQKRCLADRENTPQKRNRISRHTLRFVRKLESEPATREITPINVPRMNSVPPRRREVFDGVQVPTFRGVSRQKMVQRAEISEDTLNTGQDTVFVYQIPSTFSSQRGRTPTPSPPSVGSGENNFDWENFRVDATSSEVGIDRSLVDTYPSSLPLNRASPTRLSEHDDKSHFPSASSAAMSQRESPPPAPTHLPSCEAKTTSARLDALREVYSSIANGASQIPMSELVQATSLVRQIGTVLAERMGKKMGSPR